MYYFMGIDPGGTGAVAVIDETGRVVTCSGSRGNKTYIFDYPGDEVLLANWFNALKEETTVLENITAALESVHAMPQQGVSSTFKFGTNFGIWRGMLAAFKIPFELVTPQAWQKGAIKKADGKKASLIVARRRWPSAELHLAKHHGRADALCIAEWLRVKNIIQNS